MLLTHQPLQITVHVRTTQQQHNKTASNMLYLYQQHQLYNTTIWGTHLRHSSEHSMLTQQYKKAIKNKMFASILREIVSYLEVLFANCVLRTVDSGSSLCVKISKPSYRFLIPHFCWNYSRFPENWFGIQYRQRAVCLIEVENTGESPTYSSIYVNSNMSQLLQKSFAKWPLKRVYHSHSAESTLLNKSTIVYHSL